MTTSPTTMASTEGTADKATLRAVHCETMAEVRRHIDALDEQIVALIAERSGYVAQAGRIKNDASQIVDQPRIEAIVGRMGQRMASHGGPAAVAEATWRAMIAAFIDFERIEFNSLRQDAGAGDKAAP